jgi:acetyl-CoA carboxylase beta subunit
MYNYTTEQLYTCKHVQLHIDVEAQKRSKQTCDENFRRNPSKSN